MLRYILVDTTLFSSRDGTADSGTGTDPEKDLLWIMEGLTKRNQDYLKYRPDTPPIYKSGVRWEAPKQFGGEVPEVHVLREALGNKANKRDVAAVLDKMQQILGGEHFCDIGRILELGAIDCFPLSQKIIVRSKSTGQYELLAIGELRFAYPAYEALSYNFTTGRQEFKPIVGFVDKGVKAVSKAHLSNGTDLIATDSHKFWTLDGSQQCDPYPDSFRIGERTMGEYVAMYAERGKYSRSWWTSRSRILQAARIPTLEAVQISDAEAYLAGIYAAEGFHSGSVTGIAQHKAPVRRKIEEALVELGIRYSYDEGRNGTGSGAQYRLLGGAKSEHIARLRELGIDSFDKRLPQSYLSAGVGTIRRMLDAHADGDGWRPRRDHEYKKSSVQSITAEHSTSSDQLMEQIRMANLILGNPTYTYYQKKHQGVGRDPIWRVSEYNDKASKLRPRAERMRALGAPDLTYATVLSAEPFGEQRVGCIEVEGNHNFFLADGTLAANCDGLACWRAAELRQSGIAAKPMMTKRKRPDGGTTYHALVLWPPFGNVPYETTEDPSLLLGMHQPERKAERDQEIEKNKERCEIIQRYGIAPVGAPDAVLNEVLGVRRRAPVDASVVSEVERLLRGRT